jgi:hypothetical protein
MLAFVLADFVNGNNVRMIKPGRRFSFGVKALPQCGCGQLSGENHFECDGPIEAHLPRAIHNAHAAACDFFDQFIVSEVINNPLARR